ncbi:GntR family transcriptional regulator [Pseudodonghicola flavimaris]|uniref:GntR family transcriptional regulator n=1 Tax=Pseudodonghicola flavimaris TaxID=3050036 RepID=A0ABT7F3Y4_9RHOB|nr:GntR family transcriptional regulator [Pseudodonghicola flavimaris]MDK3019305.1 GntR family transcriptional regulator [Pseudodonghicola flavimaris]
MRRAAPFQRSAMDDSTGDPLTWRGHRDLPERISDDLTRRIMAGEFQSGERLVEAELAAYYEVSRGPIRDALRILTNRGLADLFPRRGAVVGNFDHDTLADALNVHASLSGLNARYAALMWRPDTLAELRRRVEALEVLARDDNCKPLRFALASGRIGTALTRCSDSKLLQRTMHSSANDIVWSLLWREFHVDFRTPERRRENAEIWREVLTCVETRDADAAERCMQELIFQCRDEALKVMALTERDGAADSRRLLHNRPSDAGSGPSGGE